MVTLLALGAAGLLFRVSVFFWFRGLRVLQGCYRGHAGYRVLGHLGVIISGLKEFKSSCHNGEPHGKEHEL